MKERPDIPTRASLLGRLKNPDDHASWQTFYDLYGKLIHGQAIKAGLTEDEATEVVQEMMIELAELMKTFEYRSKNGSFRAWLYRRANWRIADQFRRRRPTGLPIESLTWDESTPAELTVEAHADWDAEWRKAVYDKALNALRHAVPPKDYQVFNLLTVKEWPVAKVARMLKINRPQIHLSKFRVKFALRREITRLEKETI